MSGKLNVLLVGGTHGNELTGIHLIQRWQERPSELDRRNITSSLLVANPEAWQRNLRYIDADLNRQFSRQSLTDESLSYYESQRAKEIHRQLSTRDVLHQDFIIDMHTTTANMGVTLVVNGDSSLAKKAAAYVQQSLPDVTLMYQHVEKDTDNFLISLGRLGGILVEVGPIAQGLLNGQIFELTRKAVELILDYLSLQTYSRVDLPETVSAFQFVKKEKFPENNRGELIGMIHPDFQGRDFQPLAAGDAIYLMQSGETISYDDETGLVAAFINEAAYYDQHHSFSLLKPIQLDLSEK